MATIDWANAVSGNWTTASDWSGGVVPGPGDEADITAAGRYSITVDTPVTVGTITLDDKHASIVDSNSLTCSDFELSQGTLKLAGGTLLGTLSSRGARGSAVKVAGNGTLSGVTLQGNIIIEGGSTYQGTLTIDNGVAFTGEGGSGIGTVYFGCSVALDGIAELNNASISFPFLAGMDGYSAAVMTDTGVPTLTLGSALTLNSADYVTAHASQTLINDGTIDSGSFDAGRAGTLSIINAGNMDYAASNAAVTNDGTISGGSFTGEFTNDGLAQSDLNGSELILTYGKVEAAGSGASIELKAGGLLGLAGSLTTAQLAAFYKSQHVKGSGTFGLGIEGTLNNSGATLTVGTHTTYGSLVSQTSGTIEGGTIVDTGGEQASSLSAGYGTLGLQGVDYVSQQSTLALTSVAATDILLTGATTLEMDYGGVFSGGTLSGVGSLNLGGDGLGTLTLAGVDITGAGGDGTVNVTTAATVELAAEQNTAGMTLTTTTNDIVGVVIIGSGEQVTGAVINLDAGELEYGDTGSSVAATLAASTQVNVSGESFLDAPYHGTASLTSSAAIAITGGGTLVIDSGGNTSIVNDGTISVASGGVLAIANDTSLDNAGLVSVSSGGTLSATDAVLTSGNIQVAADGVLDVDGSVTAGQVMTLAGLYPGADLQISGVLDLGGGTVTLGKGGFPDISIVGTYNNGANGGIVQDGTLAVAKGTEFSVDGGTFTAALVNSGTISAVADPSIFGAISGTGTIDLNSSSVDFGATLTAAVSEGQVIAFEAKYQILTFAGGAGSSFDGTLSGFTPGNEIILTGEQLTSASFVGKTIQAVLSTGATLTFDTAAALTGSLAVENDQIYYESNLAQAAPADSMRRDEPAAPAGMHSTPGDWRGALPFLTLISHVT